MMRVLTYTILVMLFMIYGGQLAHPQSAQPAPRGKCVIAGRVVAGETPVRDANVIAIFQDPDPRRRSMPAAYATGSLFRVRTDAEGRYRIADLQSGVYQVGVLAPALVNNEKAVEQIAFGPAGKRVALADDEVREDVDFSLVRGGVITGRVTFADGRPLIAESVRLKLDAPKDMGIVTFPQNQEQEPETDDRGIYRIYGIPDGRYKVSIGFEGLGLSASRRKNEKHKQTFHPGVTDEAAARWIEIRNGNEVGDVDIKIGAGEKAYTVTGKVVDADSAETLGNFMVSLNAQLKNEGSEVIANTWQQTNSKGEFKLEGVVAGSYAIYANEASAPKQYYSGVTRFEVTDANVHGVEIKVHRGLTVSGFAIIEDATDPAMMADLSHIYVSASCDRLNEEGEQNFEFGSSAVGWINDDGSFSLTGLAPGRLHISARGFPQPSHLAFIRLERNGVDVTQGFELQAGEQVADLRLVFALATGKIHGQVKIEGGSLLKTRESLISVVRITGDENNRSQPAKYKALDPNGRFSIEGLVAGEYTLTVYARIFPAENNDSGNDDRQADGSLYRTAQQRVRVANGEDAEISFVIKARE
jgi:hypothetical protein